MATIEQRVAKLEIAFNLLKGELLEWRDKFVAYQDKKEAEARLKAQDDERAKRKARRR